MRTIIVVLLILAAHFSATPFVPGPAGAAKFYWPFAADSKPWLGLIGGLPPQSGIITTLLAGIATLGFIAALFSLWGWFVPDDWFTPLIVSASAASIVLYILYFGAFSLLPIALDAFLLWGVLAQGWSVSRLE